MDCFKKKKKEAQNNHSRSYNGNGDRQNYKSHRVSFTTARKNEALSNDIWICDSGQYSKLLEGMFDLIDIEVKITAGNGNSMMATQL
jgi:hypothetical protein